VATVMQNPRSAFDPVMTLRAHAREVFGGSGGDFEGEVRRAAGDVGLEVDRVLDLYPHQTSGGMLQRMMFALTLLTGTRFLIADEPTTDLDLVTQSRILDLLLDQVERLGLGVLFITHDLRLARRFADRIVVLHDGRSTASGSVGDRGRRLAASRRRSRDRVGRATSADRPFEPSENRHVFVAVLKRSKVTLRPLLPSSTSSRGDFDPDQGEVTFDRSCPHCSTRRPRLTMGSRLSVIAASRIANRP
jgi:ABC-type glutathione transport system ATPase component